MHHQWLLLAACFWVIFMFMVASKFITLTFKDPDGRYASSRNGVHLTQTVLWYCSWIQAQMTLVPEVTSKVMVSKSFMLQRCRRGGEKGQECLPASPLGMGGACFLCGLLWWPPPCSTICQVISWATGLGLCPARYHHEMLP